MPFQHLFSSNRAAFVESYYPIISDYAKIGGGQEANSSKHGSCDASGGVKGFPGAVHFTIQLAPQGIANSEDLGINTSASCRCSRCC